MLIERGLWFLAGLYVFTSVALSLGALLGAIAITRHNLV